MLDRPIPGQPDQVTHLDLIEVIQVSTMDYLDKANCSNQADVIEPYAYNQGLFDVPNPAMFL